MSLIDYLSSNPACEYNWKETSYMKGIFIDYFYMKFESLRVCVYDFYTRLIDPSGGLGNYLPSHLCKHLVFVTSSISWWALFFPWKYWQGKRLLVLFIYLFLMVVAFGALVSTCVLTVYFLFLLQRTKESFLFYTCLNSNEIQTSKILLKLLQKSRVVLGSIYIALFISISS